jgi:hypothetical protein
VVLSTPGTKETGAMGREIEPRLGKGWYFLKEKLDIFIGRFILFYFIKFPFN